MAEKEVRAQKPVTPPAQTTLPETPAVLEPTVTAKVVKAPVLPNPVIMDRPSGPKAPACRPGNMTADETEKYNSLVAQKEAIGLPREDACQSAWYQVEHDRPFAKVA